MARFDLYSQADRDRLRTIALSNLYHEHPLALTLRAALDVIERQAAELAERAGSSSGNAHEDAFARKIAEVFRERRR